MYVYEMISINMSEFHKKIQFQKNYTNDIIVPAYHPDDFSKQNH